MAIPHNKFISGLIAALKSDYAQNKITKALTDEAQLSRVFDEYKPSNHVSVLLYQQMIKSTGSDALIIELDNDDAQASISTKVNDEMTIIAQDIIKVFLTTDGLGLKQEVKLAIGDQYSALDNTLGKEKIMKMLLQAALGSYAQASTVGCSRVLNIVTDVNGNAKDATDEQLDRMQRFGENIGMKMNQFTSKMDVDYIRLTSFSNALDNAISHLEKYRAGFASESSKSHKNLDTMGDITAALVSLNGLKTTLNSDLKTMDESGDYSTAKELSKQRATTLANIIKENILEKPNLAQLNGFFEHLLNVIIITFTLGYKNYIPKAKQAIEPLEDYTPPALKS